MKMKLSIAFLPLAAAVTLTGLFFSSPAAGGEKIDAKLQARAKLTREDAQKIALQEVPKGVVKDVELEEEDGILRWSFDLKTPGTKHITEVGVDAVTGKVVENKVESTKDEAKEKQEDSKKEQN